MMKDHRIPGTGERKHFRRQVKALVLKAVIKQELDDSSTVIGRELVSADVSLTRRSDQNL
jgi:hypothetical protein